MARNGPCSGLLKKGVHRSMLNRKPRLLLIIGLLTGAAVLFGSWGLVTVWNATHPHPLGSAPLQTWTLGKRILLVSVSPDGQWVAASDEDGTIQLLRASDPTIGSPLLDQSNATPTQWPLDNSLTFSPDGQMLASATGDGPVRLRQIPAGTPITLPPSIGNRHKTVVFSADSQLIAATGYDGLIYIWQVADGHTRPVLSTGSNPARSGDEVRLLAFSDRGRVLRALTDDSTLYEWDLSTSQLRQTLQPANIHPDLLTSGTISPLGDMIANAYTGDRGTTYVWYTKDGKTIRQFNQFICSSLAFSPDSHLLAGGGGGSRLDNPLFSSPDLSIRVWQLSDGQEHDRLVGHTGDVNSVAWSQDGHRLVSGSDDGTVRLWDVK